MREGSTGFNHLYLNSLRPMKPIVCALAAGAFSCAQPAHGQTVAPSQVTPRDIAPPVPIDRHGAPAREAPVPAGHASGGDLAFQAGDVVLEGSFPELAADNADFIKRLSQRRLTVDQLLKEARALEQIYARKGYVLVRVTVPPQRLVNGSAVKLVVTDGYIEAVDTTNVAARMRAAVDTRLKPLVGKRHLTQDELERRLLIAGELAGIRLKSALAAGSAPGAARLVLEGNRKPVGVQLGLNNRLPASLGQWQFISSLTLNDIIGANEQVYVTAGSQAGAIPIGTSHSSLAMLGGGLVMPLGHSGASLAGEFIHARIKPQPSPSVPASLGDYSRAEVRLNAPVIQTRQRILNLTFTLDLATQALKLPDFSTQVSRDHYLVARIGMNWQRWFDQNPVSLNATLSQGIAGRIGTKAVPISRQGATSAFTRLDGSLQTTLPMPDGFALAFFARGQMSFARPLYLSEQFALDSDNAVSAFASGGFNVDTGATFRAEVRLPPETLLSHLGVAPYFYAAGGLGWIAQASAAEQPYITAAGLGLGARISLDRLPLLRGAGVTLGVEAGHQFSNVPGRSGDNRVSLAVSIQR